MNNVKMILLICCVFCCANFFAQDTIQIRVENVDTKKALANAKVFLGEYSRDRTNKEGKFALLKSMVGLIHIEADGYLPITESTEILKETPIIRMYTKPRGKQMSQKSANLSAFVMQAVRNTARRLERGREVFYNLYALQSEKHNEEHQELSAVYSSMLKHGEVIDSLGIPFTFRLESLKHLKWIVGETDSYALKQNSMQTPIQLKELNFDVLKNARCNISNSKDGKSYIVNIKTGNSKYKNVYAYQLGINKADSTLSYCFFSANYKHLSDELHSFTLLRNFKYRIDFSESFYSFKKVNDEDYVLDKCERATEVQIRRYDGKQEYLTQFTRVSHIDPPENLKAQKDRIPINGWLHQLLTMDELE